MYNKTRAANAHTIEYKDFAKLGLLSYSDLNKQLANYMENNEMKTVTQALDDIAFRIKIEDIEEEQQVVIDVLYGLFDEFKFKYQLDVELNYHDRESAGETTDDISGHFFELDFNQLYRPGVLAQQLMDKVDVDTKWFQYEV